MTTDSRQPVVGSIVDLNIQNRRYIQNWNLHAPPKSATPQEWAAVLARLDALERRLAALEGR